MVVEVCGHTYLGRLKLGSNSTASNEGGLYASIRAIVEDGKQGFGTIRCVLSNVLQLGTVDTGVQTDSMLDSM